MAFKYNWGLMIPTNKQTRLLTLDVSVSAVTMRAWTNLRNVPRVEVGKRVVIVEHAYARKYFVIKKDLQSRQWMICGRCVIIVFCEN